MIINLEVKRTVTEDGYTSVHLRPSITDGRTGDEVSGEIILKTTKDNVVYKDGEGFSSPSLTAIPAE